MINAIKTLMLSVFVAAIAGGCATPLPVPFQLIDSESRTQWGTIFPDSQRIAVTIDGHVFSGFYIVASGEAVSQTLSGRRFLPNDTITTFSSNSARAHLTSDNGQQLSCGFLFESRRAIGECRSPSGAVFQLIADGNRTKAQ